MYRSSATLHNYLIISMFKIVIFVCILTLHILSRKIKITQLCLLYINLKQKLRKYNSSAKKNHFKSLPKKCYLSITKIDGLLLTGETIWKSNMHIKNNPFHFWTIFSVTFCLCPVSYFAKNNLIPTSFGFCVIVIQIYW